MPKYVVLDGVSRYAEFPGHLFNSSVGQPASEFGGCGLCLCLVHSCEDNYRTQKKNKKDKNPKKEITGLKNGTILTKEGTLYAVIGARTRPL